MLRALRVLPWRRPTTLPMRRSCVSLFWKRAGDPHNRWACWHLRRSRSRAPRRWPTGSGPCWAAAVAAPRRAPADQSLPYLSPQPVRFNPLKVAREQNDGRRATPHSQATKAQAGIKALRRQHTGERVEANTLTPEPTRGGDRRQRQRAPEPGLARLGPHVKALHFAFAGSGGNGTQGDPAGKGSGVGPPRQNEGTVRWRVGARQARKLRGEILKAERDADLAFVLVQ